MAVVRSAESVNLKQKQTNKRECGLVSVVGQQKTKAQRFCGFLWVCVGKDNIKRQREDRYYAWWLSPFDCSAARFSTLFENGAYCYPLDTYQVCEFCSARFTMEIKEMLATAYHHFEETKL